MKRTTLLLTLLSLFTLSGMVAKAQTEGIQFFSGTFPEAQAKAKAENKLIFVDAYTSWCGPCRWMSANIFTDASVASYYNQNFINLKMDQEKGEGPAFARTYKVMAYPTLIFMNSSGTEINRNVGAIQTPDAMINFGKLSRSK
jgi:thiol:disulfide interchange protein